jgi:hypothetical protein
VNGRREGQRARETPYRVSGVIVQEFGAGIECPVFMVELDGERRRTVLMLVEY